MYDMLHNYNNYTNTLSRFLTGYHQLGEHNDDNDIPLSGLCEDSTPDEEPRCRSNSSATGKSFTIAAILGLNNSESANICNSSTDLSVMNLTVHPGTSDRSLLSNCGRLQLPINRHGSLIPTGPYPVAPHGIQSSKQNGKYI
ncbi:hypothetical protein HUJ05_001712 [Dendroctonus ponderosae]|nr:hypothetical protein HUJ05_001712 [Dendroctonus ponderosae]